MRFAFTGIECSPSHLPSSSYILNRGWIDRSVNRVPTYREITGSTKSKGKLKQESDGKDQEASVDSEVNDSDDEDFEEIAERFESSYNFRFEEPCVPLSFLTAQSYRANIYSMHSDAAVIKGYPRTVPSLVRREDTTRKDARERKKQRKEEELAKKKEEVKRLKGLKMKELREKLERIGREGGKKYEETKGEFLLPELPVLRFSHMFGLP